MTLENFSSGFDTLLSSYVKAAGFGSTDNPVSIELDEFEKSQFLTKYQEELVISLYNGRNPLGEGFEETEELRRYLSNLINEAELEPITTSSGLPLGMESTSKFFTLPDNLWFITYESVKLDPDDRPCAGISTLQVTPVRQDEYHKLRKNPFRGANGRRALRLDLSENNIEIVCKYPVTKYYVRYLRKIKPIVLVNLENDGLSINGVSTATECELHESLHQRILEGAVQLALRSRGIYSNNENK